MAARKHIVPVFLPQWGCTFQCIYCNQRAITAQLGPVDVQRQLEWAMAKVSPQAYPLEVAFYGGTFTALPLDLQKQLLAAVQPFVTDGRVDSIRLSTHPSCISPASLAVLADGHVKTVELGVQSLEEDVLQQAGRDYSPKVVTEAVQLLKSMNFEVGIQLMPGLPGDSKEKTLLTVRRVIKLRPDFVRVYPTVVIAGTALARFWQEGRYRALSLEEAVDWCKEISRLFGEAGIPIIRMGLHPSPELAAEVLTGPYHPAFKALVDSALALEQIEAMLPQGSGNLDIFCHPRQVSVVRGERNGNISVLQDRYGFGKINVKTDPQLAIGRFRVSVS